MVLLHILGKVHTETQRCAEMLEKLFWLWHARNIYSLKSCNCDPALRLAQDL